VTPRRGDIWLVSFGAARAGEPGKNRPAVVVSVDDLNSDVPEDLIVVVPLSRSRAPSAMRPEVAPTDGVDYPSRAICRGVRAIARSRLLRPLGALPSQVLDEFDKTLSLVLALHNGGLNA